MNIVRAITYMQAFNSGFDAYEAYSFKPLHTRPPSNPHPVGTPAHRGWIKGWERASEMHDAEMGQG